MKNIIELTEANFEQEVLKATTPVVVDFYAPWCGPCKLLAPRLDELAGPLTNRVKFVKVDVDQSPALDQRFDIQAIPMLIFFKNGKVVDRLIGLPAEDTLKERLHSFAQTNAQPVTSGR